MTCDESDAGGIVDADMDELPADAEMAIDHARVSSGDAVSYGADPAELLDVEMDQFAGVLALITADGLRLQGAQLVQSQPAQNTADGGRRDAGLGGDRLPVQRWRRSRSMRLDGRRRCRPAQPMGPGRAILQSRQSFARDIGRAICELFAGRHLRLCAMASGVCPLSTCLRSALDRAASAGHSCARSSGPPRITEASTTSAFPVQDRMDNLLKAHS